jgi:hypothetical protein
MTKGGTFSPKEVQVLITAYEGCCKKMGFKPQNDLLAWTVAKTVLEAARFGASSAVHVQKQALLLLRGQATS